MLHLTADLKEFGHIIYTDSFYTSPNLVQELKVQGIGHCGTVRQGRKNMPADLHTSRISLQRGDNPVFMKSMSTDIVACGWHDTKYVTFLSSVHSDNTMEKRMKSGRHEGGHRVIEKPVLAEDYNQFMGGVDLTDQLLGTYAYPHKVSKWYLAVYHRIREVALTNGYIIYKKVTPEPWMSPRAFREQIIDGLLEDFLPSTKPQPRKETPRPLRLTERHFIYKREDSSRPDCTVCSDHTTPGWKRVQTGFECKSCKVPLSPGLCFELYHTVQDFKRAAASQIYGL